MIKRRKSTPHTAAHNRSVDILKKEGLTGLLITGNGLSTRVSMIGNQEKSFANTHLAIAQTPWLKEIAELSTGPKISMYKEKHDYLNRLMPKNFPYDITEVGDNVEISLAGEFITMTKEAYERLDPIELSEMLNVEFDLFKKPSDAATDEALEAIKNDDQGTILEQPNDETGV